MIEIINLLETLGFLVEENGIYEGYGINKEELVIFEFKNHYLICKEGDKILFSIIYADIKTETLLVLLRHYGIVDDDSEKKNSANILDAIIDKIKSEAEGKNTSFKAKIIEMGDNEFSDVPQLYIQQKTGNRIVFDTNRDFLIDLVRGKGDKFTVYEEVMVTLTITKE